MNAISRRYLPLSDELILEAGKMVLRLAAVGLVAIGLSGILALAGGSVLGKTFVSGDLPGVTYTADRCADLLEYVPHAATCEAAATAHHFDEVVTYRIAAGGLGILLVAASRFLFASKRGAAESASLKIIESTAGATAFGVAAAALLALGLSQAVVTTSGAGANLSGGIVATPFAAFYALRLLQDLSRAEHAVGRR